jgi:pimeloyl-ACP methyl ester carboxylesterase
MSTYVLVHGSASGGFIYRPVAKILRAAAHTVYTPTLTGMGERSHLMSPAVGLDIHIRDIVNVLEFEDLRDVILVGHSYSGMVVAGVADRAADRVGHIVYMDATIPRNGESQADVVPESMADAKADAKVIDNVLMAVPPGSTIDTMIRQNLVKHGCDWMLERIRPLPYYGCYETKLVMQNEQAMGKIPTTAIHCLQVPWGQKQYERMISCDNFWEIDTVHGLMISEPEETAELLLRVSVPENGLNV